MAGVKHFINKMLSIHGSLRKVKSLLTRLLVHPKRTLDLENQDGDDKLRNLIARLYSSTEMRDPHLSYPVVISVQTLSHTLLPIIQ